MNNTIDEINLTNMYRTFYPTTKECILLKCTKNIPRIDYTVGDKTNLKKFKKIEVPAKTEA